MENSVVTPEQNHDEESQAELVVLQSDIELFKREKKEFRCKGVRIFMQSIPYQVCVTIITIFALFADDINTLAFQKEADIYFDGIQIAIMIIFLIEAVLSSIAINGYLFSFFFWLDIFSTISMIMDVNIFTNAIFYSGLSSAPNVSKLASQSKSSRAAARAVRIIRLIRLLRVVKLYKSAVKASEIKENIKKDRLKLKKTQQKQSSQKISTKGCVQTTVEHPQLTEQIQLPPLNHKVSKLPQISAQAAQNIQNQNQDRVLADSEQIEEVETKESKVSQILSTANIQKVILIMLLIMFFAPMFQVSTYADQNQNVDFFLSNLETMLNNQAVPISEIKVYTQSMLQDMKDHTPPLVSFCSPFNELPCYGSDVVNTLRGKDTSGSVQDLDVPGIMAKRPSLTRGNQQDGGSSLSAFTNRANMNKNSAYFSIGRIFFMCLVLAVLLHFFTKDSDELIIVPIEGMIQKVKDMANNPTIVQSELVEQTEMETAIVHNAILKIGNMLSLVYGQAGAEIIGTNMMKGGDMNPLTGGKKVSAIFGFCDIRNFTDATEILQQNIMIFVNQIGEIVHSAVYRYGGSANKNIGDAFLLVWKVPKDKYEIQKGDVINWLDERYVNILCDFSLLSFIKILVKINKDPKILQYKHDQKLLARLGPDYQVRMGFGLHVGWAIEGAIGSEYKIDASYLSPNVNMASRLEAATKQYDVPLLISSALYNLLTAEMKPFCRNIDRVTVKGSNQPIGLYTVDIDITNISPPLDKAKKYPIPEDRPDIELKKQLNMQFLNEAIESYDAYTFIESKKELREVLMVNVNLQQFRQEFEYGFDNYISGDWKKALAYLNKALGFKPGDGPTKKLISYMESNSVDGMAPATWRNFRELTQK